MFTCAYIKKRELSSDFCLVFFFNSFLFNFLSEGWVEQDPKEILLSVYECIEKTCEKLGQLNIDISNIKAIGVSNQRETTVVWDKLTGEPLYNAVGKLLCVDVKCKAFFYMQMWSC